MSRRTLAILLAVSAALNLFGVGAAVGGWWMRERLEAHRPAAMAQRTPGWRMLGEQLSPEGRRAFRGALREAAPRTAALAAEGRRNRAEAAELMAARTVDKASLSAALQRARAADFELRGQLEAAVVEAAARLSVEDRAALAETLRHRARRQNRPPRENLAPRAPESRRPDV
ncbi:MAG: periplasmic heavy metal sensor [Caulobacteraceae bacterium]|nr:periplasmic heavy metal sensor [Caulobacteraceae bacterium]